MAQFVKTPPASAGDAGDARDMGLISGLRRSPGVGDDSPSSILAWKIPWIGEPGGLQSVCGAAKS